MYDPRSEEILKLKARALCGEYLPEEPADRICKDDFTRLPKSALEKAHSVNMGNRVDMTEEEDALWGELQDAIDAQFFDLLTAFPEYFTGDPDDEFLNLSKGLTTRTGVAEKVEEQRALAMPSEEWPKERQDAYRARMAYLFAKRRIDGLKREIEWSEKYLSAMKAYILGMYPDCLGEDF